MLSFFELRQQCRGMSLMETVVGMGIGTLMIAGSLQFVSNFEDSKNQIKKREQERLREFSHKFYGRKFLSITRNSGISVSFFKMPIIFGDNVCGQAVGGCFMSMSKTKGVEAIPKGLMKIGRDSNLSINLFADEGVGKSRGSSYRDVDFRSEDVKSCCKVNRLDRVKYNKEISSSKHKRYFVGWTLQGEGKDFPFYTMAEDQESDVSHFFEMNNYQGLTPDDVEDNAEFLGVDSGRQIDLVQNHALVSIPRSRGSKMSDEELYSYKDRFYLFFLSEEPNLYFIAYVEDIQICVIRRSRERVVVDRACRNLYATVAVNYNDDNNTYTDAQEALEAAERNLEAEEASGDNGGNRSIYMMKLKFLTDAQWGPFHKNPEEHHSVYDLAAASFWPGSRKGDSPFVPYRAPTLFARDVTSWSLFDGSKTKDAPLAPHYVVRILSMNEAVGPSISPVNNIVAIPLKFYEMSMKRDAQKNTKDVYVTDLRRSGKSNQKKRKVLSDLPGDAHVIIARQLGTRRFSTFVYNPAPEELEQAGEATESE